MHFDNLKGRMEYYRGLTDYRLLPNSYVMVMCDGRSFSKKIKSFFKLPFDIEFINMMNECAIYACKNIQGCKLAYVQSDEISFVLTDFEELESDSFFGFRLCKMQSIIASLVTCKFQQQFQKLLLSNVINNKDCKVTEKDFETMFTDKYLFQFDCKCWVVPEYNDVFAWFKYRQNDCVRNSKQQAAQTYCSHKELLGKNTDEQIELLKVKESIDWNTDFSNGEMYGRLIYKETEKHNDGKNTYERSVWKAHELEPLTREMFDNLAVVPKRED